MQKHCFQLLAHPASPASSAIKELKTCLWLDRGNNRLQLTYILRADLSALKLPAPAPAPTFKNRLWQQSCFEAFVGRVGDSAYVEWNFSPSGDWACYFFEAERKAATPAQTPALITPPRIHCTRQERQWMLQASICLPAGYLAPTRSGQLQLGLSSVIEEQSGNLSYWALAHAGERPDFHASSSWLLHLP